MPQQRPGAVATAAPAPAARHDEPTRLPDRHTAGRQLAARLGGHAGPDLVVLGLSRGGMPVAAEVARILDAPLDVLVVRSLPVPRRPGQAFGAVGEEGAQVYYHDVLWAARLSAQALVTVEQRPAPSSTAAPARCVGTGPGCPSPAGSRSSSTTASRPA